MHVYVQKASFNFIISNICKELEMKERKELKLIVCPENGIAERVKDV